MKRNNTKIGFTLIELLVVVVILVIAGAMAVPMFSGSAQMQVQSAANMIAADLEYAKSMAISRQQNYGVVFHTDTESYSVVNSSGTPLPSHPIKKGFPYTIDFATDSRLKNVDLDTAPSGIYFDYIGKPLDGSFSDLTAKGKIKLLGGGSAIYVYVEPTTGYIRISDVDE